MDRIDKIDTMPGDDKLNVNDDQLTEKIIACAFKVHNALGAGFSEKVYENAMRIELVRQSVDVQQQVPIKVYYGGEVVGEFYADLRVSRIIVELKAVQNLLKEHEVQLVNYLTATHDSHRLIDQFWRFC